MVPEVLIPVVLVWCLSVMVFDSYVLAEPPPRQYYSQLTPKTFADAIGDLELAISEYNYRITGRNDIGAALTHRHDRPHPPSMVVHFCNLEEAGQLLSLAPDFVIHMPCKIAVYETKDGVRVVAELLPEDPRVSSRIAAVNALMRRIVDEAVRP